MNSELQIRVRTAVMIGLVMLAFLIPGYWLPFIPLLLFFVVTYLSTLEKGRALSRRLPMLSDRGPALASILLVLPMLYFIPQGWFIRGIPAKSVRVAAPIIAPRLIAAYAIALVLVCFFWVLIAALKKGVEQLPFSVFEVFMILTSTVPLAALITLFYGIPDGFFWVLLAVFTPWISDTFSYFVGSYFGQRKMADKISAKKTWEGTLGGIVGTWIFYLLYFTLILGPKLKMSTWLSIAMAIVVGLVMSLVSTAGDLFASAIKRWCRIKDFGSLLPGHGGLTDRFDSMSWTMPAVLLLALLTHNFL
ncbi:MAG TPA: phosphatidate cytidylyltransferase [Oscillospiraceae bacterium]|jgi:phosphatidate cytidylyltransferase|nr:phosphatidate cytidylyltransferase [Oscillospiraceae bacterium]